MLFRGGAIQRVALAAAATVTAVVASPATGTYSSGQLITITLTMSKTVIVTGTPELVLNDGGDATYSSGSGTNTLIFNYTVGATDAANPLAVSSVNLNGGTIKNGTTEANMAGAIVTFPGLIISTGNFTASIPLGNFAGVYTGSGGSVALNADGTTYGWTSNAAWLTVQYWVNFTVSDEYTFVIPAYVSAVTAAPSNGIILYIDSLPMQSITATTTNNNWFVNFISNLSPSQNYTWTGPVTAGWHSVKVSFNMTNYYSIPSAGAASDIHADRLNITGQGTGLPAEPAGTRNPGTNPMSSYHFINVPFGASATWASLTSAMAETINGGGGNGANMTYNSSAFSANTWIGTSSSPMMVSTNQDGIANGDYTSIGAVSLPVAFQAPAGLYPSSGSDNDNDIVNPGNPRYKICGFGCVLNGQNVGWYRMSIQDSYNLNGASPQSFLTGYGLITNEDLNSGVIAHRIIGGLAFNGSIAGYASTAVSKQTSQFSGMPWPANESDASWYTEYDNPNGVPYGSVVGIPPGTTMPGGLSAGGQMLWTCLKNYGLFLNVSVGTYPTTTYYIDGLAAANPNIPTSGDHALIVPQLSVMTSSAPIVTGQGFGGGSLVVALLPGVQQGYAALGLPTVPTFSLSTGSPTLIAQRGPSESAPGSPSTNSTTWAVPVGSFVFAFFQAAAANNTFSATFTDSAGNSYTVIQPTANSTNISIGLAYCLTTTHLMPIGTTFTANPNNNYWFLTGVYYLPPPASGSVTLHASTTAASASGGTSMSLSVAGSTNDLAVGFTYLSGNGPGATTNNGLINEASGFTSLMTSDNVSTDSEVVASSGTVTYNPSWVTSNPYGGILATFTGANLSFLSQPPICVGWANNSYFSNAMNTIMAVPVGTFLVITTTAIAEDIAFTTMTDAVGNTYHLAIGNPATSGVYSSAIWYCNVTTAMPLGTTITCSQTSSWIVFIGAVGGVTGTLDKTAQASSSASVETLSASTSALSAVNEIVVGICNAPFNSLASYAAGGTFNNAPVYGVPGGYFDYQFVTTTGAVTYAPSWTAGQSSRSICVATFTL